MVNGLKNFPFSVIEQIIYFLVINLKAGPVVIKSFFMLNSAEHGISNAHKYKSIKKLRYFNAQISLKCYFSSHKC